MGTSGCFTGRPEKGDAVQVACLCAGLCNHDAAALDLPFSVHFPGLSYGRNVGGYPEYPAVQRFFPGFADICLSDTDCICADGSSADDVICDSLSVRMEEELFPDFVSGASAVCCAAGAGRNGTGCDAVVFPVAGLWVARGSVEEGCKRSMI